MKEEKTTNLESTINQEIPKTKTILDPNTLCILSCLSDGASTTYGIAALGVHIESNSVIRYLADNFGTIAGVFSYETIICGSAIGLAKILNNLTKTESKLFEIVPLAVGAGTAYAAIVNCISLIFDLYK